MTLVEIVNSARFKTGVAVAGLAALGMAVASSCNGCDNNEQAKATITPEITATVTYTPEPPATFTPESTATPAPQNTPIPGYNCPGVTLDYIAQTGQTNKLTAPFSGCVDAEWVAVPMGSPPKDIDEAVQKMWDGNIAYTILPGTDIIMPMDGIINISRATEKGILGIGGYTCQIVSGNYSVLIMVYNAELDFDKNNTYLSRGTVIGKIGKSDTALPSKFNLGKSNLLLGFFAEPTAQQQGYKYDLSLPGFWVDEKVATSYLAVQK